MHKSRTGNFTGTEASRTDVDVSGRAVHDCLDALHVGLPGAIGTAMGMGNLDTEGHSFSAAITLCHLLHLLFSSRYNIISNEYEKCNRFGQKTQKRGQMSARGSLLANRD